MKVGVKNKKLGKFGEDAAMQYLLLHGYKILDYNYQNRYGEIDIIVSKDDFIAFVEVKTRGGYAYGRPSEAVNNQKQHKIRNLAASYMAAYPDFGARFDIAEVIATDTKSGIVLKEFNYIENAFC